MAVFIIQYNNVFSLQEGHILNSYNENTLTGYKAQDFISALSSGVFFALSGEQNEHTHELNHGSSTRI